MKRKGILHPELAISLAQLGHLDRICVADAGLPIPTDVLRIDLAFHPGEPPFFNVLEAIREEIIVESLILARETGEGIVSKVKAMFPGCAISSTPHERFKELLPDVRIIVRTGEFTPYCNVILSCGVPF